MSAWLALAIAGVLTWGAKALPSTVADRLPIPPAVERASAFVAPAVLGALTARGVTGQAMAGDAWPVLAALVVAVPVAVRFRSIALTLAAGSAALTAVSLVG